VPTLAAGKAGREKARTDRPNDANTAAGGPGTNGNGGRPPGPPNATGNGGGGRVDPDNFTKWVARMGKHAGIPGVHPHPLRHSLATLLLAQRVGIETIADVLGHSSVVLTASTYAKVLDAGRSAALDRGAAALSGEPVRRGALGGSLAIGSGEPVRAGRGDTGILTSQASCDLAFAVFSSASSRTRTAPATALSPASCPLRVVGATCGSCSGPAPSRRRRELRA